MVLIAMDFQLCGVNLYSNLPSMNKSILIVSKNNYLINYYSD
jgi:hypothetical protein